MEGVKLPDGWISFVVADDIEDQILEDWDRLVREQTPSNHVRLWKTLHACFPEIAFKHCQVRIVVTGGRMCVEFCEVIHPVTLPFSTINLGSIGGN